MVDGISVRQAGVGGDGGEEAVADEADQGLDEQEAVELLVTDNRDDVIVGSPVWVVGLLVESVWNQA